MIATIIGWLAPASLPDQIAYATMRLSHSQGEALLKMACFLLASTVRVWWVWTVEGWVRM